MSGLRIAVVGATGAVGAEILKVLEQRQIACAELRLFASPSSRGRVLGTHSVESLGDADFPSVDFALFSAGASRSREFGPQAVAAGAIVIDNSSAFRMDAEVPLVVPEINIAAVRPEHRLIANPNCTAIMLLMALAPLRRLGNLARVVVSTYQSASGAGAAAMEELRSQTRAYLNEEPIQPEIMPHPYAFNLFSHNSPIGPDGHNDEELKVIAEARKILEQPQLPIAVTCVRVPVLQAHTLSVNVEFEKNRPELAEIEAALSAFPGVSWRDDRAKNHFPMPVDATGQDDVLMGRLREDPSHPRSIQLMVCGDQLRKGAALNAVQIMQALIERGDR